MYLNIAICDDEKTDCRTLEELLYACCSKMKLNIRTNIFSCGESFLASHQKQPYDIVFMDIYMTGINGIRAIRDACLVNRCQAVITTISREHAMEAFGLDAAHYLLKPLTKDGVREAIKRCLPRLEAKPDRQIRVKTNRGVVPIPIHRIVYIEVFDKICCIHTEKNTYQTYSTLSALFDLLDDRFFMRAQRSYIINMGYIEAFHFDRVILQGGKEVVLSRGKRAKLKNQYQQFLFYLARRGEL